MKKLFILFFIIIFQFNLFSAEILNKGERASHKGILLTEKEAIEYKKSIEELGILKNEKIPKLNFQIFKYEQLLIEKNVELDEWILKYNSSTILITNLKDRIKSLQIQNRVLWVLNGIGWSIAVGETAGIIVYGVFKFN